MKQYSLIGYHATDKNNVNDIIENGFLFNRNKRHWLGNGIYFYLDPNLAKWWTSNPSKQFGDPISNSSIIKCHLKVSEKNFINLRKLSDFEFFLNAYNEYLDELTINGTTKSNDINILRCSFCDYVVHTYNIHAIIGAFNLPKQSYLPKEYFKIYRELRILYPETQLCVFNQTIIEKKELL